MSTIHEVTPVSQRELEKFSLDELLHRADVAIQILRTLQKFLLRCRRECERRGVLS